MKPDELEVHQLDVASIRVMISRKRDRAEFEAQMDSMKRLGLKMPIQVRDITQLPAAERKRPEGGLYKYELVFGQGRLEAAKELGWTKIPGTITAAPEAEIAGRFLSENINREGLPWFDKAKLVIDELNAGASVESVAEQFSITKGHVYKFKRIVGKLPQELEDKVSKLPMNDAEALTALEPDHQRIVMATFLDTPERQVRALTRKAQQIIESGKELSTTEIKASIERDREDLKRSREAMKPVRLHHSLGPQNLQLLLANPKFAKALEEEGISVTKFQAIAR